MINHLIESLTGEALDLAMQIGTDALCEVDKSGITQLRASIRDHVFPVKKEEVKALFREGQRQGGGILARQPGEPMKGYIKRREQWFRLLIAMEPAHALTDEMRGDLLLDNASISDIDRRMIKNALENKTPFEPIKRALIVQHPNIHLRK